MPYHEEGAYDGFDRLSEIPKHYKRCRKVQNFILSDKGINRDRPKCPVCKKGITTKGGNRGLYHPDGRVVVVMHYYCAWDALLSDVFALADMI